MSLHDARHTFATLALSSGKNPVWVSKQLGHSDPAFTLRVYAHALPTDETDLSFLDFGGTKRHPRGTKAVRAVAANRARLATPRRVRGNVARREGFEPPTLRFEA